MREVLEAIAEHQAKIGAHQAIYNDRMAYIRDMVVGLTVESAEFLQELPWKPWKPENQQTKDYKRAQEELVDMFIFLFNLWFAAKGNPFRLKADILHKIEHNLQRLDLGEHQHTSAT